MSRTEPSAFLPAAIQAASDLIRLAPSPGEAMRRLAVLRSDPAFVEAAGESLAVIERDVHAAATGRQTVRAA